MTNPSREPYAVDAAVKIIKLLAPMDLSRSEPSKRLYLAAVKFLSGLFQGDLTVIVKTGVPKSLLAEKLKKLLDL